MWVIEQNKNGGIIAYQNYENEKNDKWIYDIRKRVQCPNSFKMIGWKQKTQDYQSFLYLPNQTNTSEKSNYTVTDKNGRDIYTISGTKDSLQNGGMVAVPYSETVAWIEHEYECKEGHGVKNTNQKASIEEMDRDCKSKKLNACLVLAYDLREIDPKKSYQLFENICLKNIDTMENKLIACSVLGAEEVYKNQKKGLMYYKISCDQVDSISNKDSSEYYIALKSCSQYGAHLKNSEYFNVGLKSIENKCYTEKSFYECYDLACLYSVLKNTDEAIKALEYALQYGFNDWKHLEKDKDLDNVRNFEKFKLLINKYRDGA
jgi:hypothetical protein